MEPAYKTWCGAFLYGKWKRKSPLTSAGDRTYVYVVYGLNYFWDKDVGAWVDGLKNGVRLLLTRPGGHPLDIYEDDDD